MNSLFSFGMPVFPYDPKIDSEIAHRHLILAYCLTWLVHVSYALYVAIRSYLARKEKSDY